MSRARTPIKKVCLAVCLAAPIISEKNPRILGRFLQSFFEGILSFFKAFLKFFKGILTCFKAFFKDSHPFLKFF